jgi:hypothetical protein
MTIQSSNAGYTTNRLRLTLLSEMDALRRGETTPSRARAVAAISNAVVSSLCVEAHLRASSPECPSLGSMVLAEGTQETP